jgi:hypothetical protein
MLHEGCVVGENAFEQNRLLDPTIGKARGAIELYGAVRRRLRNHPGFAAALEHEGIGEMVRPLQHGARLRDVSFGINGEMRDDAFAGGEWNLLAEDVGGIAMHEDERVGEIARAAVGKGREILPGDVQCVVGAAATPSDLPAGRLPQESREPRRGLAGDRT